MVGQFATGKLTRFDAAIDYFLTAVVPALGTNRHGRTMQVVEADPGLILEDECIIIGNVDIAQEWAPQGGRRKDEHLVIDILILVRDDGATSTAVRNRAIAIGNDIAAVLRERPHTSANGLAAKSMFRALRWRPGPAADGRTGALFCQWALDNIRF